MGEISTELRIDFVEPEGGAVTEPECRRNRRGTTEEKIQRLCDDLEATRQSVEDFKDDVIDAIDGASGGEATDEEPDEPTDALHRLKDKLIEKKHGATEAVKRSLSARTVKSQPARTIYYRNWLFFLESEIKVYTGYTIEKTVSGSADIDVNYQGPELLQFSIVSGPGYISSRSKKEIAGKIFHAVRIGYGAVSSEESIAKHEEGIDPNPSPIRVLISTSQISKIVTIAPKYRFIDHTDRKKPKKKRIELYREGVIDRVFPTKPENPNPPPPDPQTGRDDYMDQERVTKIVYQELWILNRNDGSDELMAQREVTENIKNKQPENSYQVGTFTEVPDEERE